MLPKNVEALHVSAFMCGSKQTCEYIFKIIQRLIAVEVRKKTQYREEEMLKWLHCFPFHCMYVYRYMSMFVYIQT
jgi:hypothetical protein